MFSPFHSKYYVRSMKTDQQVASLYTNSATIKRLAKAAADGLLGIWYIKAAVTKYTLEKFISRLRKKDPALMNEITAASAIALAAGSLSYGLSEAFVRPQTTMKNTETGETMYVAKWKSKAKGFRVWDKREKKTYFLKADKKDQVWRLRETNAEEDVAELPFYATWKSNDAVVRFPDDQTAMVPKELNGNWLSVPTPSGPSRRVYSANLNAESWFVVNGPGWEFASFLTYTVMQAETLPVGILFVTLVISMASLGTWKVVEVINQAREKYLSNSKNT